MTAGLAVGVTAAVVVACTAAAYVYSVHHFQALLESEHATARAEGELIRAALEHQMMENDRTLIARMIASFGRQARVEQVVVLDRNGVERFSSGPHPASPDLRIDSQSGSSRVIETRGGTLLRTVIPIPNNLQCHRCHDARQPINGTLILDYNAAPDRAAMTADLRWMVAGTGAITLLLVGAIVLVIRVSVLRRLQRFEITARQIAAGDLQRRVPAEGTDTLAWLAREFNTMADSVTGLVGEVRNQRERLETVINSIDDGIVVLDPERKILAANDAFLERARSSREQVVGCCCNQLESGACTVTDCPTQSCLRSGQRQVRICERRTAGGAVAWEEVHASPILDGGGKLMQVVEVWRDISERRAAEAHLAESHRLASLGVLASGFSHELNTPLATVLMCVEGILRDTNGGDSHIRESASVAREQLLRCRGITQHFLRMSRGQRSPGDMLDLHASIEAVARLIDPTARAHGVAVELQLCPSAIHVRAEEAELQNLLINLLLNAIQASPGGARVTVTTESGAAARIRVSDEGCGIAPEFSKRIFEPFFSLRPGGTGLGLFLSLNFVRRWGGDILLESAPGKGSTFEVIFPQEAPQ